MRFLVFASLLFVTLLSSAATTAVACGEFSVDLAEWLTQGAVEVIAGAAVIGALRGLDHRSGQPGPESKASALDGEDQG